MAVFQRPIGALRHDTRPAALAFAGQCQTPSWPKSGYSPWPVHRRHPQRAFGLFRHNDKHRLPLRGNTRRDDLIISDVVYQDPEITDYLAQAKGELSVASLDVTLKGFEAERFRLWRLNRLSPPAA